VDGQCEDGTLIFTFTVSNAAGNDGAPGGGFWTVDGPQSFSGDFDPLGSPDSQTFNLGSVPPGTYMITVSYRNETTAAETTVVCNEPTATPTNTATPPANTLTPTPPVVIPPQITGSGLCTPEGLLQFTVTNTGSVPSLPTSYQVFGPNGQLPSGNIPALQPNESVNVPFGQQPDGTYSFFTTDGLVTVAVECQTPVICVEPEVELDENGLPVFNTDPVCADTQLPKTWTPVEIGGATCPDYAVYHTDVTLDWEIFRLGELPGNPGAEANLSQGIGPNVVDVSPARSPDAEWIAFTSNRDGNWELYIGKIDGTEQRRVTFNNFAVDTAPMWSPSGDSIAFQSNRDGNWNIYLLNLATGAETQVTDNLSNEISPVFSPDGTKIAFQSDRDGLWQIYEVTVATGEQVRLSDGTANDFSPLYNGQNTRIAFQTLRGAGGTAMVYLMNVDGSNLLPVSEAAMDARNLSWSGDGALLAYNSDADGDQDIYVYEVATALTRKLTDNTTNDVAPTWLCEAPTIIWTSNATADQVTPAEVDDIYQSVAVPIDAPAINVSEEASRLTDNEANNRYPQNYPPVEFGSRDSQQPPELRGR
jgi:Tol biopolymer transport system component